MVFNTGAALLDAIVLAVVSNDAEGTYGYKITRMYVRLSRYPSLRCTRFCGDSRRMDVWRPTTWSTAEETADTTGLRRQGQYS